MYNKLKFVQSGGNDTFFMQMKRQSGDYRRDIPSMSILYYLLAALGEVTKN